MDNKERWLRVVLMADFVSGGISGGIEQFVGRLIHALGKLSDGNEEYVIVTSPRDPGWVKPFLGRNQRVAVRPWASWRERLTARVPVSEAALTRIRQIRLRIKGVPTAGVAMGAGPDPFLSSLAPQVVHFTYQKYTIVEAAATIFNPHDLLHRHHPETFAPEVYNLREALYPTWCEQASTVAVDAPWVKGDLVEKYGLRPEKIVVAPFGARMAETRPDGPDEREAVRGRLKLPESFTLYPAQTWLHKNHIRLIEALALLRDRDGLRINLVCTGLQNEHWLTIRRRIDELGMGGQVQFLGFVSASDLRALYRMAQFVIIPSLFEGAGIPVLEAFAEGTPVVCSNTTSLPEMAGKAALFFDPLDVEAMAAAIKRMASDENLRAELARRAAERLTFFTWERTARTYRALYRKLAGWALTDEDRETLDSAENWPD